MSSCTVMNLEEELDEVSQLVDRRLDKSTKEVYIINSILAKPYRDKIIKSNNKKFHFVQFLPYQYNYRNIDKETDGYIEKVVDLKVSDLYSSYHFFINSTQRVYYKIKN